MRLAVIVIFTLVALVRFASVACGPAQPDIRLILSPKALVRQQAELDGRRVQFSATAFEDWEPAGTLVFRESSTGPVLILVRLRKPWEGVRPKSLWGVVRAGTPVVVSDAVP